MSSDDESELLDRIRQKLLHCDPKAGSCEDDDSSDQDFLDLGKNDSINPSIKKSDSTIDSQTSIDTNEKISRCLSPKHHGVKKNIQVSRRQIPALHAGNTSDQMQNSNLATDSVGGSYSPLNGDKKESNPYAHDLDALEQEIECDVENILNTCITKSQYVVKEKLRTRTTMTDSHSLVVDKVDATRGKLDEILACSLSDDQDTDCHLNNRHSVVDSGKDMELLAEVQDKRSELRLVSTNIKDSPTPESWRLGESDDSSIDELTLEGELETKALVSNGIEELSEPSQKIGANYARLEAFEPDLKPIQVLSVNTVDSIKCMQANTFRQENGSMPGIDESPDTLTNRASPLFEELEIIRNDSKSSYQYGSSADRASFKPISINPYKKERPAVALTKTSVFTDIRESSPFFSANSKRTDQLMTKSILQEVSHNELTIDSRRDRNCNSRNETSKQFSLKTQTLEGRQERKLDSLHQTDDESYKGIGADQNHLGSNMTMSNTGAYCAKYQKDNCNDFLEYEAFGFGSPIADKGEKSSSSEKESINKESLKSDQFHDSKLETSSIVLNTNQYEMASTSEVEPCLYAPVALKSVPDPIVHYFTSSNRPLQTRRKIPVSQAFNTPVSSLWESMFATFNPLQSEIANAIAYSDDNVVLSAPTGAGKTVAFEMAIARFLDVDLQLSYTSNNCISKARKIVYLSPSKALCEERYKDWSCRLHSMNLGIETAIITGDGDPSDSFRDLVSAHLILTTPEKWDSITRRWIENFVLFATVKLFMIDEVHLIGDENRGCCLESIVCRMKTIQRAAANNRLSEEDIAASR